MKWEGLGRHVISMNDSRTNNLIFGVIVTMIVCLCLAWFAGWVDHDSWWPIRIGVLGAVFLILCGLFLILRHSQKRDNRLAERHFEVLLKLDAEGMFTEMGYMGLPPLPPENSWYQLSEQIRQTLASLHQRIETLEQSRTLADIRSRRTALQAEQMRQILSVLVEPILAVDDYDEIVLANQSAEDLFHLPSDAEENRVLTELVQCQKLVDLLKTTRQHRNVLQRSDEIELPDAEGRSHWYRATAMKFGAEQNGGQDSESRGAVAVLRDIGDQKTLQKRNAEFVSSVSHEMKTPLAGIKAYVELLVDGDAEDDATREEFLNVINSQADRLQRLVENLLNIARIEAGVVKVSKQQRSLNELLEEALNVVRPSAEAKNIELSSELSPLYLGVLADRDMLLQAAINLLSNAIKYTPNGGRVVLRSRMIDDQIRFEVQDTGVGLSEEDAQRVFEKFYRVKKDKDMASGTGLGLPLAKHIVEDVHGGALTVESVLGQGSTFIVTLPSAGKMHSEG